MINISEQIINKEIEYKNIKLNKIIPTFTISNLYMLMYVSFRSEMQAPYYNIMPFWHTFPHPHFWHTAYHFT
jgi:hypothetical protein